MIKLRPYQRRTLDQLYSWMRSNKGNPCIVLPTGAGKSVVIAALCQEALTNWPSTKILMLTHQRELIRQNAEKLLHLWFNAPLGVFSAGLNSRQVDAITFAGIQTARGKAKELGHFDLVLVDECHLISHKDDGTYCELLKELTEINPALRVIGLTATPYRLGHGLITDKPAIFDDLLEPTSIEELQALGFLAKLRSRVTTEHLTTEGVHKRGGDYIESELQKAVDVQSKNSAVAREIVALGSNRKSWLIFCAGVDHADHVRDELRALGVVAESVNGGTPTVERDRILGDFKAGRITAVTNCSVLTTGFDAPNIDLIAMLRPTESAVLYLQMAGRGLRVKDNGGDCLVLDFAGVIERHGPITFVRPPDKAGEGDGIPPSKSCPECMEIVHAAARVCPGCGFEFPPPELKPLALRDDDIQGDGLTDLEVCDWAWTIQASKNSGKDMLVVDYLPSNEFQRSVREYICVWHDGFFGKKARDLLADIVKKSGCPPLDDFATMCKLLSRSKCPGVISYRQDGKYKRIEKRTWNNDDIPF